MSPEVEAVGGPVAADYSASAVVRATAAVCAQIIPYDAWTVPKDVASVQQRKAVGGLQFGGELARWVIWQVKSTDGDSTGSSG